MQEVYQAKCGVEGCKDTRRFPFHNRAEYRDLIARYGNGKYRCLRHTDPTQVLSAKDQVKRFYITSSKSDGFLRWNHLPFLSGPGFIAFAEDFPEGTILEVTARVDIPEEQK